MATDSPHIPQKRKLLYFSLILIVVLICAPVWQAFHEIRHEQANRSLLQSIKNNDTKAALEALDQGADADAKDVGGEEKPLSLSQTLAQTLARIRHRKTASERLHEEHAPTALWVLFNYRGVDDKHLPENIPLLKALLQKGARVNQNPGGTPLCWAAANSYIASMLLLLQHGADVKKADSEGRTALFFASSKEALQTLLDQGAPIDVRDIYGRTGFRVACDVGQGGSEVPLFLIRHGTDLNARDKNGDTELTSPVDPVPFPVMREMIAKGADVNTGNNDGTTPLMQMAAFEDQEARVAFLLAHGAKVNARDKTGAPALFYATRGENRGSALLLLEHGADANVRDNAGATALLVAVDGEDGGVVEALLKHGADSNVRNKAGKTPLAIALKNNHDDFVALLKKYGAKR